MIHLPEIKTAELSTYVNFAKCRQTHFRVSRVGLGTRLVLVGVQENPNGQERNGTERNGTEPEVAINVSS